MEDLLDKLGSEEKVDIKDFKVDDKITKNVEDIADAYKKGLNKIFLAPFEVLSINSRYKWYLENLPKNYCSTDITNLSIQLENLIAERKIIFTNDHYSSTIGLFLSALINNCNDAKYHIFASHWKYSLHDIGYGFNGCKEINIIGDVVSVGTDMTGGLINVMGDVKIRIGDIHGGIIVVKGNVANPDSKVRLCSGEVLIENNDELYVNYYYKKKKNGSNDYAVDFSGEVPKDKFSKLRKILKSIE